MDRKERNNKIAAMVIDYRNGNEDAFTELYNETFNDLIRYCRKDFGGLDETRIEEIVLDSFEKISRCIDTLDNPVKYLGWAHQVVYRTGIDTLRKERKYVYISRNDEGDFEGEWYDNIPDESIDMVMDSCAFSSEIKEALTAALRDLSEDKRMTFYLYYYKGLTMDEIAEVQDIRPGTVKSRLFAIRQKLREELKEYKAYVI